MILCKKNTHKTATCWMSRGTTNKIVKAMKTPWQNENAQFFNPAKNNKDMLLANL